MAISFDFIREKMETEAETIYNDRAPDFPPIEFENTAGRSTALVNAKKAKNMWGRMTILDGEGFGMELGGNRHRYTGVVVLQLFTDRDKGVGGLRTSGQEFAQAMKTSTALMQAGIQLFTPSFTVVGIDDNNWFQANVSIPYELDQTLD